MQSRGDEGRKKKSVAFDLADVFWYPASYESDRFCVAGKTTTHKQIFIHLTSVFFFWHAFHFLESKAKQRHFARCPALPHRRLEPASFLLLLSPSFVPHAKHSRRSPAPSSLVSRQYRYNPSLALVSQDSSPQTWVRPSRSPSSKRCVALRCVAGASSMKCPLSIPAMP